MNNIIVLVVSLLLILTVVLCLFVDYIQDIKLAVSIRQLLHEEHLAMFLIQNREFSEKYPLTSKVIRSFEHVDFRRLEDYLDQVKPVGPQESDALHEEMHQISTDGTDDDKMLLGWYIFTCEYIEIVKSQEIAKTQRFNERVFEEKNLEEMKEKVNTTSISDISGLCLC